MKTLLRMLRLARNYPGRVAWVIVVGFIYSAFHNSFAVVTKEVIRILQNKPLDYYVPWQDMPAKESLTIVILVIGVSLLIGKCGFQYTRRYLQSWLSRKVVIDAQNEVASHLLTLDMGYYQNIRQGELVSRMTNDMRMLSKSVTLLCIVLTRPITLLGGAITIFCMNWRLALLGVVAAPIGVVIVSSLSRKMRRAAKRSYEQQADATNVLMQFMAGIRTVKIFTKEDDERNRFSSTLKKVFNIGMKGARARARVRPIVELLAGTGMLCVMYIGSRWVLDDKISLDELLGVLAALGMIYAPAKEMSNANSEMQEALPAAERVFDILNSRPMVTDAPDAIELQKLEKGISIKDLNFSYKEGVPVLNDINLELPRGKCLALVGPSGSGKSTLADLVARFHDPQGGSISIDGTDIRKIKIESLLKNIAIVSQDAFLFNETVAYNIGYGRPDATQEDIVEAAKAASIHDEIMALPQGYDTIVGDRGDHLSGGQRQRVWIARAILKNAPLLILDEATSALDTRSERLVQEALESLMRNRTSIVIAHRLSTIRHADQVVVLQEGRITAQGTHDELITQGGMYATLWALQCGEPSPK